MARLWDRGDEETEESWTAFKSFRDQNPPRQLKRVAGTMAKPLSDIVDMAAKGGWRERVRAYDDYLDAVVQAEREEFLKQDARIRTSEHTALLKDARDVLALELRKLLEWSERAPTVNVIQPQVLTKLLDVTLKLERLVAGESTENTATTLDLSGLSIEELRTVEGILSKAGVNLSGAPQKTPKPS